MSSPATLGQFHYVTDPNTGLTHVLQQTDTGPGVRTQKLADIAVGAASKMGYTQKSFEAQQERVKQGLVAPWEVMPTGFGSARPTKPGQATQTFTSDPGFRGREDEDLSIGKTLERYDALREQQAPVAFRRGSEAADEAGAHLQQSAALTGRQEGGPVLGLNVPSDERLKELSQTPNVQATPFDEKAERQKGASLARFNFRLGPGWDAMIRNQQNIIRGAARIQDEREYKYDTETGEPLALYRNPPEIGKLFHPRTGEQIGLRGSPLRSVYGKAKYGDDPPREPLRFPEIHN